MSITAPILEIYIYVASWMTEYLFFNSSINYIVMFLFYIFRLTFILLIVSNIETMCITTCKILLIFSLLSLFFCLLWYCIWKCIENFEVSVWFVTHRFSTHTHPCLISANPDRWCLWFTGPILISSSSSSSSISQMGECFGNLSCFDSEKFSFTGLINL